MKLHLTRQDFRHPQRFLGREHYKICVLEISLKAEWMGNLKRMRFKVGRSMRGLFFSS